MSYKHIKVFFQDTAMGIVAGFLLWGVFGAPANASVREDFKNNGAPQATAGRRFTDIPVMDVTIPSYGGEADVLQAITVKDAGNAVFESHIAKVKFWADGGPVGFQGTGADVYLGEGVWHYFQKYWYLKNANRSIPREGLRLFVTVDTTASIVLLNAFSQFEIPVLNDVEKDNDFDLGDRGVFVNSGNNGPVSGNVVNPDFQVWVQDAGGDTAPPVSVFLNVGDGSEIKEGNFIFFGRSRDQGDAAWVGSVKIDIDGVVADVETQSAYREWTYARDFVPGEYRVKIIASDTRGNESTSPVMTIRVLPTPKLSEEVSRVEVDAYAKPFTESVKVAVRLSDESGNPLPQKTVAIFSSRTKDTVRPREIKTDVEGVANFFVSTSEAGESVLTIFVEGKALERKPRATFYAYPSGQLIKGVSSIAVYLLRDGKRYVFPKEEVYRSYFSDFSGLVTINDAELAKYPLGGNMRYAPGTLLKIPSVPKVYAVGEDGKTLRWIETEALAKAYFGDNWAAAVKDVSEAFFLDYAEGESIGE